MAKATVQMTLGLAGKPTALPGVEMDVTDRHEYQPIAFFAEVAACLAAECVSRSQ